MWDPESWRLINKTNNQLWTNTKPFIGVIKNMKKVLQWILSPCQNIQMKEVYISQISSLWKVSKDKIQEFHQYLEAWEISQEEIKKAIQSFLNTRAIEVHSDLSHPDVFMKKWKKVRLQKFVNDIDESDKYILAYAVQSQIITQAHITYLHFTDGETLESFMNTYASLDLVDEYFQKLTTVSSCIN